MAAAPTSDEIDKAVAIVEQLLGIAAGFYLPLKLALPFIMIGVRFEAGRLKSGLANGSLVPDGRGGIVPASNSKYDPKTGAFLP